MGKKKVSSARGRAAVDCGCAACTRPMLGKKNSAAEEAVALLQPKGTGTATANVVVQHTARQNFSPNSKRHAASRTPTKDDIV